MKTIEGRDRSRRAVLAGLAASVAAPALGAGFAARQAAAQTSLTTLEAIEALRLVLSDLEPGALLPGAPQFLGYSGIGEDGRAPQDVRDELAARILTEVDDESLTLVWPEDGDAPDYRHFGRIAAADRIEVGHETLARAAARNFFAIDGDVVLVGLRGAELLESRDGAIVIAERRPSHLEMHCVLGVWNRAARLLTAWAGSTVPAAPATLLQQRVKNAGRLAQLAPTGLHRVEVAPHRPDSPYPKPGAFKFASQAAPLRSYGRAPGGVAYTTRETWDIDAPSPSSAIHVSELAGRFRGAVFSSAGAATLGGGYDRSGAPRPTGDWAAFRAAAGLEAAPAVEPATFRTREDGRTFPYLLLTGRDLQLATVAPEDEPGLRRLRIGSSGAPVRALQRALRLPEDGVFGFATQVAFLTDQLENYGAADGVVTPSYARDDLRFRF